jgi:hypothetical protein
MQKVTLAAMALLCACGGTSSPSGELLHADLERQPNQMIEEEPGPDGLVLRILNLGDEEPRHELRYERRAAMTEDGRIEMLMSVAAADAEGRQGQHQTAPVRLEFEVGPTEMLDEHLMRYHVRITGLQVGLPSETPEEVLAQIARETDPLRQLESTVVVDDRGIVHERIGETPEGLAPHTLTLLGNIRMSLVSPVLPLQPIGEGAVWEVKHIVDHGTFEVEQVVSYELVSFEGHTGRLQVTLRQHALPSEGGTAHELTHYESIGGGYIEFDRRHLVPEAQITGRTHVDANVRAVDRLIPTQSEMSVAIRVEPAR